MTDNTLSVYIKRLREKIEDDPGNPKLIHTVRGLGYKAVSRMRNKEFRNLILILLVAGALASAAGFFVSVAAGIAAAACSLLFIIVLLAFTWQRYVQIKRLCEYLKRINSGDYALDVRDNTEGELSILKSEIYKVTVMLRERGDMLQREKKALADALSDISHQLKTPLTSMLIMTDLLCDAELPEAQRRTFTSRMRFQLERLQWLVSSLLKMSRLDAGTVKFNPAAASPQRRSSKKPARRCSSPWNLKPYPAHRGGRS